MRIAAIRDKFYPTITGVLQRWLGYKTLAFLLASVILINFGDLLLPLLGQGLHLLIEVVEAALEHLLEHAFGLKPRQAQFVLAYSALILSAVLIIKLAYKAYQAYLRAYEAAQKAWQQTPWFSVAISLGIVTTVLFLFM